MSGLLMKYFVLKPSGDILDSYAMASRNAMRKYASCIEFENPQLAQELINWANSELKKASDEAEVEPDE